MAEATTLPATTNDAVRTEANRSVTLIPRVDIRETDNEMLLLAELPGVKPEDVDVRFENGELILHGRRHAVNAGKRRTLWEYEVANYYRTFRVTEKIAADRIHADLKNGVLTVHLPKAEAHKPRRIAIAG
jgi:HSP20 family protein